MAKKRPRTKPKRRRKRPLKAKKPRSRKPEKDPLEGAEISPALAVGLAGVKAIADIAERFGLTGKQATFVITWWTCGHNATTAAVAAGYSRKSARSQGCQLLNNPNISRAVAAIAEAQGIRVDILHSRLLSVALEADVRYLEPWLMGKETLEQAHARGVNTKLLKSAKVRTFTKTIQTRETVVTTVTETREVVLHDPLKAIGLLLPGLDASKEVKALERGPEYDYTVGQMLTREFLEQVPRDVLEGIPGLRLLPGPKKR